MGTFLSSQRFGKKSRSGLALTRIVRKRRFTSGQPKYNTSCSRKPVSKNVEKRATSESLQVARNLDSSSCVYSQGSDEIRSGNCTCLVIPDLPLRLQNWAMMMTL